MSFKFLQTRAVTLLVGHFKQITKPVDSFSLLERMYIPSMVGAIGMTVPIMAVLTYFGICAPGWLYAVPAYLGFYLGTHFKVFDDDVSNCG